ncbi:hypothetical protein P3T36_004333 [Kitasatospora sp. MAP12-15]|nr:hypothetical protein [Kitasatospora sp. MAP12-44]
MKEFEDGFDAVDICELSDEALDDIVGGGSVAPMTAICG